KLVSTASTATTSGSSSGAASSTTVSACGPSCDGFWSALFFLRKLNIGQLLPTRFNGRLCYHFPPYRNRKHSLPSAANRPKTFMNKPRSTAGNSLRIIAGQWRSRRLRFPDVEGLRPTPDRIRETLFNWLQDSIPHANCLDLFA